MKWTLSPEAFEDLDAILTYVEQDSGSPRVANRLLDDFRKAFDALAEWPDAGRVREELTGDTLRWTHVHRYLVVYDPKTEPLQIIRVIHGSRFLPAIFDEANT